MDRRLVIQPVADPAAAPTEAAKAINSPQTLHETLDAIVRAARASSVPGFDHVGISITHRTGAIETLAGTDRMAWDLDSIQYQLEEGPCVDSLRKEPVVVLEHAAEGLAMATVSTPGGEAGVARATGPAALQRERNRGGSQPHSMRRWRPARSSGKPSES
jgi:hypothetical protein